MSWPTNHAVPCLHHNNLISFIETHTSINRATHAITPNREGTDKGAKSHLEREDEDEEHVGRQIRQERDGDPWPQEGSEPVSIPARASVSVEERGRPPLQRGGAGRRGGGRDVEAVHRRHAPRIGRRRNEARPSPNPRGVAPDPERGGGFAWRARFRRFIRVGGRGGQAAMPRAMARPRGRDGNARNRGEAEGKWGQNYCGSEGGILVFLDRFNYGIGLINPGLAVFIWRGLSLETFA